ncbi:MAG: DUF3088 family protein [Parvularculaceae bacterium]
MTRSTLFLLPASFGDEGRRQFCPECAELWGFLHYFPEIRDGLDIRYEAIAHPRAGLVALLGEGRWNCPTLVLGDEEPASGAGLIKTANGRRYIDNARDIERYYAEIAGTPNPR